MTFKEYMVLEGKLEDFVKDNGLSKDAAFSDENIKKLKRILKLSPEKTKLKLEKYFAKNPESGKQPPVNDINTDKKNLPKITNDVRSETDNLPEDKRGLFNSVLDIIGKTAANYAAEKAGKLLDELFMGNFKDAVIEILEKNADETFDDEETVKNTLTRLKTFDGYKKAAKRIEIDSRKDMETSVEIDEDSTRFMAMWYSADQEENVGVILSNLVRNIQQSAKKLEDDSVKVKNELKKMKIELTDEQFNICAPVLFKLIKDKTPEKEIRDIVQKLTKQVNESVRSLMSSKYGEKMLDENELIITESEKNEFLFESICGNDMIMEAIVERMLLEGWFGDAVAKIKNSKFVQFIKQKSAVLGKKLVNTGSKGVQAMTKYSIGPMLQLGGIAVGVATGGFGAELIIKAMDFVEKNGKSLKNAFERYTTMYANTKGVITKMNYHLAGDKTKTYSLRFYEKDMVWRLLNTADQLKHPSIKYSKQIIDSELGKKYRNQLKTIWDPLFSDIKGGKIDFVKILEQSKSVKIDEKALQAFQQFADNYESIMENCITSPKIDTRAQKLK